MPGNAEIAGRLRSLAQLRTTQKENPFKARAYRAAAKQIETLSESIANLVQQNADRTPHSDRQLRSGISTVKRFSDRAELFNSENSRAHFQLSRLLSQSGIHRKKQLEFGPPLCPPAQRRTFANCKNAGRASCT